MRLSNLLSDKLFLKRQYKKRLGKELDFKDPKTFNEKMQWLKLYERTPLHTLCADKYAVREYIKAIVGEEYLIPLLYHTENVENIKPENLPDLPFIIKTNHDSSGGISIRDKSKADWNAIRKKLKKLLSKNYYYHAREWQYKHIKSSIIVEPLLENLDGKIPEFKLHCFNGKVKFIQVHIEKDYSTIFYDLSWNIQPIFTSLKENGHLSIHKPPTIDKMISISEKLASPFSYVRIDFYDIDRKIYFGEITFHHIAGFNPFKNETMDIKLGDMITLPYEQNKGSLDI